MTETQEFIQARSAEIEVATLPDIPDPVVPHPQVTEQTDIEKLKQQVNQSFEVFSQYLFEVEKKNVRIVPVLRTALTEAEIRRVAEFILSDDKLVKGFADKMMDVTIWKLLKDLQQAVQDIEKRLDRFNDRYGNTLSRI
jgi:hypothetical protein